MNQGKISSHLWFFQGLCKTFNPKFCTLLDCGTSNLFFINSKSLKKTGYLIFTGRWRPTTKLAAFAALWEFCPMKMRTSGSAGNFTLLTPHSCNFVKCFKKNQNEDDDNG